MNRSLIAKFAFALALALAACGQITPPSTSSATATDGASPALVITAGGATARFSQADLLARDDTASVTIDHDPAYAGLMTYRAVPLKALLASPHPDSADT